MKTIHFAFLALLSLSAFTFTGCAGSPSLPYRQIDRPYTLPTDTRQLTLGARAAQVKENFFGKSTRVGYVVNFESPINDSWTWELLTVVRHQFHHDEADTFGIRFGTETLGWSSFAGFMLNPVLSFYGRHKFSSDFALQATLGGEYVYRSSKNYQDGWSSFLKVSPLFQLDSTKSVAPFATLSYEKFFGGNSTRIVNILPENRSLFTVPVGMLFAWRLGQQWETTLDYTYYRLGYSRGFSSHTAGLLLKHFW